MTLLTYETQFTNKMSIEELEDIEPMVNRLNDMVHRNAEHGISPCVVAILNCKKTDDYDDYAEVIALVFFKCWQGGYDKIQDYDVRSLATEIRRSHGNEGLHMRNYPSSYWVRL